MNPFKIKDYELPNYLLRQKTSFKDCIKVCYDYESSIAKAVRDGEFKIMFQTEYNKRFACYLISKFVDIDYETLNREMILYKNEFSRKKLKQNKRMGDFVGKIGTKYISLEMNNNNTLDRNVKYAYSLYGEDVEKKKKNENEKEELVHIYDEILQININNFSFEGLDDSITVNVSSDGNYKRTSLIIIDVYLPNIVRKYRRSGKESLTDQERTVLAMFISNEEDAIYLSEGDDILMIYISKLRDLKKNKKYDYELEKYFIRDQIELGRAYGKEEGREEGLEEGRKENTREIVQKMIKKGVDTKTIHEYTDYPLYEIERLKNTKKDTAVAEQNDNFSYGEIKIKDKDDLKTI